MNIIHHWILYHSVNNFVTFLVISSSGQTVSVWIEAIGCFINELDWKPNWFCHFYIIVIFWTALYGDIIQSSIWFSNIKKYENILLSTNFAASLPLWCWNSVMTVWESHWKITVMRIFVNSHVTSELTRGKCIKWFYFGEWNVIDSIWYAIQIFTSGCHFRWKRLFKFNFRFEPTWSKAAYVIL